MKRGDTKYNVHIVKWFFTKEDLVEALASLSHEIIIPDTGYHFEWDDDNEELNLLIRYEEMIPEQEKK